MDVLSVGDMLDCFCNAAWVGTGHNPVLGLWKALTEVKTFDARTTEGVIADLETDCRCDRTLEISSSTLEALTCLIRSGASRRDYTTCHQTELTLQCGYPIAVKS